MKKLAFFLPLFCMITLVTLNVAFSGKMVGTGEEIHALEKTVISLNLKEKELESALSSSQSLQHIRDDAVAQGYVPIGSVSVVDGSRTVALR